MRRLAPRQGRCASTGLALLALLAAGSLQAAEGARAGIGVEYSRGDYGTQAQTEIMSVPLRLQLRRGRWQFDASLPWLRVSGDRDVVPGLGLVRGDGFLGDGTGTDARTASGTGDLDLAARHTLGDAKTLGVALGVRAKLAIADAERGLGTGADDYGVTANVHRQVGGTLLFAGVGHTWLGESPLVDARTMRRANAGFAHAAGRGQWGVQYEQRSALAQRLGPRREASVFLALPAAGPRSLRLRAARGLSDASPDWSLGLEFSVAPAGDR